MEGLQLAFDNIIVLRGVVENQKVRKFEDNIQQMNVSNQRLRDSVDQMSVKVNAVQSNIDQVKNQSGGTALTEETMRSWVQFFLGEQIGMLKTEMGVIMDTKLSSVKTAIKTQEANTHVIDVKLQNTLQEMWESTCFVYGFVINEVGLYTDANKDSTQLQKCAVGEKLLLEYPVIQFDDDRWMKVKMVDPITAELKHAFVPIFVKSKAYVGNFCLV